ncbi:MAG TPA: bifunctional UDP-N-acetylglucosamine diphosphorylase/glucosamine-1-phosphate N-acetyltransferase GlmU [Bryobacteraceae bacterium]|nr:bifunctional UDP-N-acetylglucosamine diphosphorylase/glucosamine-1-phosphate N-acetyltransferase GlmU [Bryobacteraceae bacterium]
MDIPVTVLILAAGLGTRMKSKKAKVLHRAGGMALIEHATDAALKLTPPERVFIVVGHQADEVMAAVGDRGVRFVQQAEPKGTGHAVMAAREALEGAGGLLLVLYGDAPLLTADTLLRLVARQQQGDVAATVLTTMLDDPSGYGRVLRDEHGRVRAIVEQKAASPAQLAVHEINSGIYCFDSGPLWKHIGEIKPENPANEYYLTDIVGILHGKGHAIAPLLREDPRELLGINTRVELAAVDRIFRDRTIRRLMLDGVTIKKPETVTIDSGVSIGMDTVIEPFAQVLGRTTIGEDCVIGACSIIRGSQLGDGVVVEPFTLVLDSAFEPGARVGPFARVRMESHVGREARVGNFVELKKARLGAGAKSLHLAYLGDTEIGEEANIGAGTITCNYDGVRKHRTKIGRGVFVGSNATLVAPVVIGDGSYIGAGSVVTENVPEDALALGRARQVNKAEWAKKRRERKLRPDTQG